MSYTLVFVAMVYLCGNVDRAIGDEEIANDQDQTRRHFSLVFSVWSRVDRGMEVSSSSRSVYGSMCLEQA